MTTLDEDAGCHRMKSTRNQRAISLNLNTRVVLHFCRYRSVTTSGCHLIVVRVDAGRAAV